MEGSLGFEGDGGTRTQGLDIPEADAASSERSIGFSAAYATPQSERARPVLCCNASSG